LIDCGAISHGGVGNTLTGVAIMSVAKAIGLRDVAANAVGYTVGLD
jgi:hypothetical protein